MDKTQTLFKVRNKYLNGEITRSELMLLVKEDVITMQDARDIIIESGEELKYDYK